MNTNYDPIPISQRTSAADSVSEYKEVRQEGDSGGEIALLAEKVDTI